MIVSREIGFDSQGSSPSIMGGAGTNCKSMSTLAGRLRETILREGVVSFRRFMETALYEPDSGYYERARIGRRGDFQTSVTVGPLFGELLALQFAHWLNALGPDVGGPLFLVEAGAHDGRLAADILQALEIWSPELASRVTYVCWEPSRRRRLWQEQTLSGWRHQVRWVEDWRGLGARVRGVIFSNELLDALPFHRFVWARKEGRWRELGVGWEGGQFVCRPMEREEVEFAPAMPEALRELLPDGFCTEYCPAAEDWWAGAAGALEAGRLVAIDYGLDECDFFAPHRSGGTARGYRDHQLVDDLPRNPGEQDLTAHVNFTRIRQAGERAGLETETDASQARFLTRILAALQRSGGAPESWFARRAGAFQTLTHPDHFGRAFRVLVQSRAPCGGFSTA